MSAIWKSPSGRSQAFTFPAVKPRESELAPSGPIFCIVWFSGSKRPWELCSIKVLVFTFKGLQLPIYYL